MGRDAAFITGSDFLMDGGVTANFWFGDLAPAQSATSNSIERNSECKRVNLAAVG